MQVGRQSRKEKLFSCVCFNQDKQHQTQQLFSLQMMKTNLVKQKDRGLENENHEDNPK